MILITEYHNYSISFWSLALEDKEKILSQHCDWNYFRLVEEPLLLLGSMTSVIPDGPPEYSVSKTAYSIKFQISKNYAKYDIQKTVMQLQCFASRFLLLFLFYQSLLVLPSGMHGRLRYIDTASSHWRSQLPQLHHWNLIPKPQPMLLCTTVKHRLQAKFHCLSFAYNQLWT